MVVELTRPIFPLCLSPEHLVLNWIIYSPQAVSLPSLDYQQWWWSDGTPDIEAKLLVLRELLNSKLIAALCARMSWACFEAVSERFKAFYMFHFFLDKTSSLPEVFSFTKFSGYLPMLHKLLLPFAGGEGAKVTFCRCLCQPQPNSLLHIHDTIVVRNGSIYPLLLQHQVFLFHLPEIGSGWGSCTCTLLQMHRKEGSSFCFVMYMDVNPCCLHCRH